MENDVKIRLFVGKRSDGSYISHLQVKCPKCGVWMTMDKEDDMINGRCSILHQCGFHAYFKSELVEV